MTWPHSATDPYVQVGNLYVPDYREKYPDLGSWDVRELSEVTEIFIHHSAAAEKPDEEAMAAIYRYHTTSNYGGGNGWPGIGYNFCVGQSGIYLVGSLETVRAHTYGHNRTGIGVCFLGDFSTKPPTPDSLAHGVDFLNNLRFGLGANLPIRPHSSVTATRCPGTAFDALIQAGLDPA